MNCYKIISTRRSIRKYAKKQISDDTLKTIINAGIWAPSGLNNQPWKFQIICNESQKNIISEFTKYSAIIKSAQVLVCIFLDKNEMYNRDKDLMSIGACIQNMLLSSWELGIGSCWLGEILNRKEEVCSYLSVTKDLELMAVISLGYPEAASGKGQRKDISDFLLSKL
ncbi:MAG: nitroreductase [Candidatus Omnitrophota bacterium]